MNSKTENNNSHKIDLHNQEDVKSILPDTDMNTTTTEIPFVRDLISRIKRTYKTDIVISTQIMNEIDNMYPITSGCWFADWLNHRLYAEVMAKTIMEGEPTPDYVDFEELEETLEEETEEEEETEDEEEPEVFVSDMNDGIDTSPEEEAYTADILISSLPTYEKVIEDMENFIKDLSKDRMIAVDVFGWLSEYSRRNHARMVVIASKLCAIEEDYYHEDFDVPEKTKKEIFNIGCDIDREGGLETQQACFYIAVNFISPTNNRIKAIEICWSGAGSWRY